MSGYPFVNVSHTHTHRHLGFSFSVLLSLFFVLFSTVGGQSGKCVASYRAGKNARTSFLASARQRPWQTLKSALPNIIAAGFEETMDVCFAHALSLNFFTPSRTSQHSDCSTRHFSSCKNAILFFLLSCCSFCFETEQHRLSLDAFCA